MTMKITRIEEFVTAVPHIPSIEKSRPGDYQERPISVIKVDTDEGICGVGEGGRGIRGDRGDAARSLEP